MPVAEPTTQITAFVYEKSLYWLPKSPSVQVKSSKMQDPSTLLWLLKECDVRPVSGQTTDLADGCLVIERLAT